MKVYCLKDEAYGCPDQGFHWIAYWYEAEEYEGFGQAVALDLNGKLQLCGLGHCSCYGPFDSDWDGTPVQWSEVSLAELRKGFTSVHGHIDSQELQDTVSVLLDEYEEAGLVK